VARPTGWEVKRNGNESLVLIAWFTTAATKEVGPSHLGYELNELQVLCDTLLLPLALSLGISGSTFLYSQFSPIPLLYAQLKSSLYPSLLPHKILTIRKHCLVSPTQRGDPTRASISPAEANIVQRLRKVDKPTPFNLFIPRHEPGEGVVMMVPRSVLLGFTPLEKHLKSLPTLSDLDAEEAIKTEIGPSIIARGSRWPPLPSSIFPLGSVYFRTIYARRSEADVVVTKVTFQDGLDQELTNPVIRIVGSHGVGENGKGGFRFREQHDERRCADLAALIP